MIRETTQCKLWYDVLYATHKMRWYDLQCNFSFHFTAWGWEWKLGQGKLKCYIKCRLWQFAWKLFTYNVKIVIFHTSKCSVFLKSTGRSISKENKSPLKLKHLPTKHWVAYEVVKYSVLLGQKYYDEAVSGCSPPFWHILYREGKDRVLEWVASKESGTLRKLLLKQKFIYWSQ